MMRFKKIKIIFSIILSILAVYVLWKNIRDLPPIEKVNYGGLIGCIFSYIFLLIVTSGRQWILLREFGLKKISIKKWFMVYVTGRFLSKFIPQGGNIYRGVTLKLSHDFPYSNYLASLVTLAWTDMIFSLFVSLVMILFLDSSLMLGTYKASIVISSCLVVSILSPVCIAYIHRKTNIGFMLPDTLKKFSITISTAFRNFNLLIISKILLIGVFSIFVSAIYFYCAFYILGYSLGIVQILFYVACTRLLMTFHFTPGNLGIRELLFGYMAELIGIGVGVGITVSLITRGIAHMVLGILSFVFRLTSMKGEKI